MPRPKTHFTKATHQRRLKEGRGQGDGAQYRPYIYVQDFSSRGQSNRDFGLTTKRQHDLFSKLEHRVYLVYDNSGLLDIKEQYPLPLELTLRIARQCGIRHPVDRWTKEPIPITTDLVLTIPRPIGSRRVARCIKYSNELIKRRTIEKLELERRTWQQLNSDWGIITERNIDLSLVRNLLWAYKFRSIESLHPLSPDEVLRGSQLLTRAVATKNSPLCETALLCDHLLGFRNGTCLNLARHLIASRKWSVELTREITATEWVGLLDFDHSLDCGNRFTSLLSQKLES
jgi:TnsA endonuclease-like protein